MKKDITPKNNQGQPHGYWEQYWSDGQLDYKGSYNNGKRDGWWECYWLDSQLWYRGNYINEKQDGLWIENDILNNYKQIRFYL
jgi:antitoxin component YwqK of YwqJK toxin-antitoxin module